jgi:hypothetical protein
MSWRSYWGVLADEPFWVKALAWTIKPGLLLMVLAAGAYCLWSGRPSSTTCVDKRRQVTDFPIAINGPVNVSVLDAQPLPGADLAEQVPSV